MGRGGGRRRHSAVAAPPPAASAHGFGAHVAGPAALALAAPRTPLRDAGIYGAPDVGLFCHFDMADDDPEAFRARVKVRYPVVLDRIIGLGEAPTVRLQRTVGRRGDVGPLELRPFGGALELVPVPHGTCAYILLRHRKHFERSTVLMAVCFDARVRRLLASAHRPAVVRWPRGGAPAGAPDHGRGGGAVLGTPLGPALPVLFKEIRSPRCPHSTSVPPRWQRACSHRSDRGTARAGWTYALTLGFGLVYLGEHYVVDLLAGLALSETLWHLAPRLGPAARALRRK